jgi:hypothetical protein
MVTEDLDPMFKNAQGIPSHGFQKKAMKWMPDDHPYHRECNLALPHDLFGIELFLAAIPLLAAFRLVHNCFTGESFFDEEKTETTIS